MSYMPPSEDYTEAECYVILMPVFDDWQSLGLVLTELDKALYSVKRVARVVIVDDASMVPFDLSQTNKWDFLAIKKIGVLSLIRNVGHQRAIALGLAYIEANMSCQAVVIMDADGEDDPRDVPRLIEKCMESADEKLVFAQRTKRSESRAFKSFYALYKGVFKILTGYSIRMGNFSIVPKKILNRLVYVSEIWNHYAVGVMKAKIPNTEIPTSRSKRLAGKSRMSFVSLVVHGLSAISVFADVIGVRLLVASLVLLMLAVLGISVTVTVRLATNLAIPGWATYVSAILLVIALQALILSFFFIFTILSSRNNVNFVPAREYSPFVLRFQTVYPSQC
jgi:hypothetical protein